MELPLVSWLWKSLPALKIAGTGRLSWAKDDGYPGVWLDMEMPLQGWLDHICRRRGDPN
jgi:hypothetical protein